MKEKLYTIPVNDAFNEDHECPLCFMRGILEKDAIDFTMGPSYMEDDIRAVTSELGFCQNHLTDLNNHQNRLGLALIIKSYMDKTINDIEKLSSSGFNYSKGLFKKKDNMNENKVIQHIDRLNNSCYICDKVNNTFKRYIATIFYLYRTDDEFKRKFDKSKGFCTSHYSCLHNEVINYLKEDFAKDFINSLNRIYLDNMKRVRDDLDWFITKFDYRYANEPWKNSKDAVPRSLIKIN